MNRTVSVLLGILFLYPYLSFACSIDIPPLRKDFRRANSVFIGKALEVKAISSGEQVRVPENWHDWKLFSKISFQVLKSWKGDKALETKEFTSVAYFDCGCPGGGIDQFEVGKEYLVFAEKKKFVSICLSEKVGSDHVRDKMKRLDDFWFRTWARVYPF